MKKQVAILLLFCYAGVLFRPLVPCITDILAHTFWESEHLATVHFEDGKYHVHIEIQKANEDIPVKPESAKQVETNTADHFPPGEELRAATRHSSDFNFPERHSPASSGFSPVPTPPPWHS